MSPGVIPARGAQHLGRLGGLVAGATDGLDKAILDRDPAAAEFFAGHRYKKLSVAHEEAHRADRFGRFCLSVCPLLEDLLGWVALVQPRFVTGVAV